MAAESGYGVIDNARVSLDFSARGTHSEAHASSLYAVGLDLHTVLSGESGDIGTLTFQPYLLRIANEPNPSGLFSDGDKHALQWRIANFNYTGLGHGRFNLRIGHFEVPFGLEQVVQTNGTLNQMNAPQTLGLKADWGVSINGEQPSFEYEIAYLRGGGNEWSTEANGYFAGRIGSPRYRNWWIGASALSGEVGTTTEPVERSRFGIDGGLRLVGGLHALAEYAAGRDDGQHRRHAMLELGYTSRSESTFTYLQWRRHTLDRDNPVRQRRQSTLGVRYEPSARWSGSVECRYEHDALNSPTTVIAQLRVRT